MTMILSRWLRARYPDKGCSPGLGKDAAPISRELRLGRRTQTEPDPGDVRIREGSYDERYEGFGKEGMLDHFYGNLRQKHAGKLGMTCVQRNRCRQIPSSTAIQMVVPPPCHLSKGKQPDNNNEEARCSYRNQLARSKLSQCQSVCSAQNGIMSRSRLLQYDATLANGVATQKAHIHDTTQFAPSTS
jgi:hypothetical protein